MSTQQSSNQNFLGTCVGVIVNPIPTMQAIVQRRLVGWAVIVIVIVSIAQGIAGAAAVNPADFEDAEWLQGTVQGFSIVGGPVFGIAFCAFFTLICWVMSLILGGRGSYAGLFAGFGFAYLPALFSVPVSLMSLQLGPVAQGLSGLFGLAIAVWSLILAIFAVQANNKFSTGRAIAAVLIPFAIIFFLLAILIIFIVVMILIAVNDGFA